MPSHITPYYFARWVPGGAYHVYNRAVYKNRLFLTNSDHFKFVEYLRRYTPHFCSVYAYSFVINHFHLAVRLHSEELIREKLLARKKLLAAEKNYLAGEITFNQLIGNYWGNLFKSYAKSFNLRHDRYGTLFDQTVRRIRVRGDVISRRLVMYIHTNEVKHRINDSFTECKVRSSYSAYVGGVHAPWIDTSAVVERFGGPEQFVRKHAGYTRKYGKAFEGFNERDYFGYGQPLVAEAPLVAFLEDEW